MDLGEDYRGIRSRHPDTSFAKVFTFNSARKSMSTVIPLDGGGYRVFTKGASEIIMKKCSFILGDGGRVEKFSPSSQDRIVKDVIEPMARDGLRTISIAFRDFVPGKADVNQVRNDCVSHDVLFEPKFYLKPESEATNINKFNCMSFKVVH